MWGETPVAFSHRSNVITQSRDHIGYAESLKPALDTSPLLRVKKISSLPRGKRAPKTLDQSFSNPKKVSRAPERGPNFR